MAVKQTCHNIYSIFILMVLLFLAMPQATAQTSKPQLFETFIPTEFFILDSASGNLNKDAYKDLVLILKSNAEENNSDTTRPLMLLAGAPNGRYTLMARNDHVVLCKACGGIFGDPYQSIAIKNGYFSIEHYGGSNWRWTRIITFKYDIKRKMFLLHRDAGVSFHTSNPDKTENLLYNKASFGKQPLGAYTYDSEQ